MSPTSWTVIPVVEWFTGSNQILEAFIKHYRNFVMPYYLDWNKSCGLRDDEKLYALLLLIDHVLASSCSGFRIDKIVGTFGNEIKNIDPVIPSLLFSPVYFLIWRQSTGVEVADEVVSAFNDFKLQQGEKLRYIIFSIENKKTIVISEKGERSKTYDDFCSALPDDDCRYGLIDLDFTTTDGRPTSKLVLITWNPDTASVRSKMLYSGSKEALKTALNGVGVHINATDRSELDFDSSVLPACQKFA